ncbi:hypothetical protein OIU34_19760 [Pararhizobium sp. BT-229]|uniref:hypothetical protein n=1 Tax=Pararhizobium sp. BT-229 TaxID=2986923 RepID=UPI0021F76F8E|nr:hypothetical protein [Pararhizobium sp. BT-229]MCV9964122.1 hypothetical protein [Pararhizobium sp. BT-229]
MRFSFEHPAVVTGKWENGHVRRELVRVAADFEIAEYSSEEAPRTFTVRDLSTELCKTIRTLDKGHYMRWRYDEPSSSFGSDSQLLRSIYNGKMLDFQAIGALVSDEIKRVQKITQYKEIENTSRRPLKRELEVGLDTLEVSCMKAPILKNWQWLGPDVQQELSDWRDRIGAVLANIILVDGIPHMRTFEPCHRVRHTTTFNGRVGDIEAYSALVYTAEPDRTSFDPKTGLENLGGNALMIGTHYFAATERPEAFRFAEESGWGVGSLRHEIEVHDESAVGLDFLEMETVRHARILHDRAGTMLEHVKDRDGVDIYCGQAVDTEMMRSQIEALRASLLDWQSERKGTDELASPFEDLLEHVMHWEDARPTKSSFGLPEQMASFKVREDMSPVIVAPIAGATPCA